MKILGVSDERSIAARRLFESEWRRRHPSTDPPQLYPPHPEDPIWREADELMEQAWAQVAISPSWAGTQADAARGPQWAAVPGYVICPKNHSSPATAAFCSGCGLPIPAHIANDAKQAAIRLGEKAGLAFLRDNGFAAPG